MNRFFVQPEAVYDNKIYISDEQDIKHISKVLRLKEGDEIEISDSVCWEYIAEIAEIEKDRIQAKIVDKQKFANEPFTKITLFQGVPKQGKMELIIQKNVELGVTAIVPVFTARTVVTDNGKFGKKIERWQKIADEAVKQCKRGIIPQILQEKNFKEMVAELETFDLVLFPYENEENRSIKDALREIKNKPENVAIIIGPEGGFSDEEAAVLKNMGTECVTLGKTTLRTETAGIATVAMTMYELEL